MREARQSLADLEQVLAGTPLKVVAYERGVQPSVVSNNVRDALDRLGLVGVPLRVARAKLGRPPPLPPKLTPRQRECLELQASGLTVAEIAERLGLSPSSVSNHLHNARHGKS